MKGYIHFRFSDWFSRYGEKENNYKKKNDVNSRSSDKTILKQLN